MSAPKAHCFGFVKFLFACFLVFYEKRKALPAPFGANPILLGTYFCSGMKKILLPFLLFASLSVSAQDTLVMKNGRQFIGHAMPITPASAFLTSSFEFVTEKKGSRLFDAHKVDFVKSAGQRVYPYNVIHRFDGITATILWVKDTGNFLRYMPINGKREKKVRKDRVFSYRMGGTETVLFKPYISNFDTLTVEQARSITEGRQDARRYYKNPWTGLVNFGIGFASGYFMNYWGILVPATYAGVYTAINPVKSKRKVRLLGPRYLTDEYYRYGFNSKAKIIKLKWSAGGGLVGLLAGVGLLEYLKSQDK